MRMEIEEEDNWIIAMEQYNHLHSLFWMDVKVCVCKCVWLHHFDWITIFYHFFFHISNIFHLFHYLHFIFVFVKPIREQFRNDCINWLKFDKPFGDKGFRSGSQIENRKYSLQNANQSINPELFQFGSKSNSLGQ